MREIFCLIAALSRVMMVFSEYLGCAICKENFLVPAFLFCKAWEMFAVDLKGLSALSPILVTLSCWFNGQSLNKDQNIL